MYTEKEITEFIFLDIETVSEYETLTHLENADPLMAKLWSKRCEYLRRRYVENVEITDDKLYAEKAGLHPEFSKIICISIGVYNVDTPSQVRSFSGHDEKSIVADFMKFMKQYFDFYQNKGKLVGHNIKRFDIPFILKRAYKYGIEIPFPLIDVAILKPWESPIIDTTEMWGFGAWQESFVALELLTHHLGIPSPKVVMHANEVGTYYWDSKDITTIAKYCNHDVVATINVLLKFANLPILDVSNVTFI